MLCWLCYWPWSDQIRCEFGWEVFNRRLRKVLYCPSGHLAPFLNHVHWPFIALERPFCRLESGVKATGLVSQTFPQRFGEFLYTNSEKKTQMQIQIHRKKQLGCLPCPTQKGREFKCTKKANTKHYTKTDTYTNTQQRSVKVAGLNYWTCSKASERLRDLKKKKSNL